MQCILSICVLSPEMDMAVTDHMLCEGLPYIVVFLEVYFFLDFGR